MNKLAEELTQLAEQFHLGRLETMELELRKHAYIGIYVRDFPLEDSEVNGLGIAAHRYFTSRGCSVTTVNVNGVVVLRIQF